MRGGGEGRGEWVAEGEGGALQLSFYDLHRIHIFCDWKFSNYNSRKFSRHIAS